MSGTPATTASGVDAALVAVEIGLLRLPVEALRRRWVHAEGRVVTEALDAAGLTLRLLYARRWQPAKRSLRADAAVVGKRGAAAQFCTLFSVGNIRRKLARFPNESALKRRFYYPQRIGNAAADQRVKPVACT